jgi:hypothetical protein
MGPDQALALDWSAILLVSDADIAGAPEAHGLRSGARRGANFRLTLVDRSLSAGFRIAETSVFGESGDSISLRYTGAEAGENHVLRVKLARGNATRHATIPLSGTSGRLSISLDGLPAGAYTGHAWLEKGNAAGATNYGSVPGTFGLAVEAPAAESAQEQSTPVQGTSRPTITGLSPSQGPVAGGTLVTLIGANLSGATGVTVGGVNASITAATATQIAFATPAGTAGAVDVAVTTPGGTATMSGGFTYFPQPTIGLLLSVFGPEAGGTVVNLTGTNLIGTTGVTVGGTPATNIIVHDATEITFTTPAGTAGLADVAVTTPGGTDTMADGFAYVAKPTITSLSPSQGSVAGGSTITLYGTNLIDATGVTGVTGVTVGGKPATSFYVNSATQMIFNTPAGAAAGAVDVSVTTPGGTATMPGGYTYFVPSPTITGLTPSSGPETGNIEVTLTGTNLTGASEVTVGGTRALPFTVNSDTQITFTTPGSRVGARAADVVVTTPGGSATMTNGFTYVAEPTITSMSPSSGAMAGGTEVTLTGTYLTGATVTVGGKNAPLTTAATGIKIIFTTPAGTAGDADVVVTTPGGTATRTGGFTYVAAPPTITSLTPSSGPLAGGTEVTLTGTNLTTVATVKVGEENATNIKVVNATQITFTTPAGAAGAKDVTVVTTYGTYTKNGVFTYFPQPTITKLEPNSGSTVGGETVTLFGTNLTDATNVNIGGNSVQPTIINDTEITFITPPWNSDLSAAVVVFTQYGGGSNWLAFKYVPPLTPGSLTLAASPDMTTEETGAPDSSGNQTPDGVGEDSGEGATPPPAEGEGTPPPDAGQPTDGQDAPGGSAEGTNDGQGEAAVSPPPDGRGAPPLGGQGAPPPNGQGTPPAEGQGAPPLGGQGTPSAEGQGAPPPNSQGTPPPEGQGAPSADVSRPAGAVTRLTILLSTAWRSR